jgi:IS30 family transposase
VTDDRSGGANEPPEQGGMSSRAMATALGVNRSTILRDLASARTGNYLIRGLDRKLYTRRTNEDRLALIGVVHTLKHREQLSVRGIVARVAEANIRVSVGAVHGYLRDWTCEDCDTE